MNSSNPPSASAGPARRSARSPVPGAVALAITWLFLWSWLTFGVLAPLTRLPWSA
ncbi:MAG: hypothetical protein HZB56_21830 [Deltaproteobacteria bacterium]|nr:hypothetical protein [Deltaproteobacteria bacterium]